MKLFYVYQEENNDYDTYSDFVCCCESEDVARLMHPRDGQPVTDWTDRYSTWAPGPEYVTVKYIGEAHESVEKGVVCASFHAG